MKKTVKKVLALSSGAVLLVAASVMGTMAYLTDNVSVANTFTVGKVDISLDEAWTNEYGKPLNENNEIVTSIDSAKRVSANEYKLIPGMTYTKDPTIHVDEDSEECYLFVKVENGISGIEKGGNTATTSIASQLTTNHWHSVPGAQNYYYYSTGAGQTPEPTKVNPETDNVNKVVFSSFIVDETATAETLAEYKDKTVKVTAYAIQAAGMTEENGDPLTIQAIWKYATGN